jgi:hypothetical protein
MSNLRPTEAAGPRLVNSPVAWFSELIIAIDRGEYIRASEAQGHLARLGWSVAPEKSGQKPHEPRHEAAGRGVGR